MKKFYPIFLFCLLSGFLFEADALTIYVNASATGMNTGTTWDDAYTDLQMALTNASEGDEIRVAQGTYYPGVDPSASFVINTDLVLLGGFNASTGERDPAMYETILSGDLNDDDEPGNFDLYKSDNVWHVVRVLGFVSNDAVIDGFTIRGGYANGDGPDDGSKSGGGLRTFGGPIIRQCLFTDNSSHGVGGALALGTHLWEETYVENCRFIGNQSRLGSGVDVRFRDITFTDCVFENNSSWESPGSNFERNGGGLFTQNSNCVIINCSFDSNTVTGGGGGFFYWIDDDGENFSLEVDGCTFAGNEAADGGGLFVNAVGENNSITIKESEFLNNTSINNFGGGALVWMSGEASWGEVLIDSCRFAGNTSAYGTAGLDIGSPPKNANTPTSYYTITNSQFLNNEAEVFAGAMELWADDAKAEFQVNDCQFDGNSSDERTGAVSVFTSSSNFKANVERCVFRNNESAVGAAVAVNQSDFNLGTFPKGAELILDNCLIAENEGDQAIIAIDSFPDVQMINCTIANNTGGGIQIEDLSGLSLQNTILYNPGFNEFEALTNDVIVTSIGGNLIGDSTMLEYLSSCDQHNIDPLLNDTFRLMEGSPAIDAGFYSEDLTDIDLDGNDRVINCVDIGAYESEINTNNQCCMVGAREVIAGKISLFPNPVTDYLHFQLPETIVDPIFLQLFDLQGQLVAQQEVEKGQPVNVKSLTPGTYLVKGVIGNAVYAGRFIRQ